MSSSAQAAITVDPAVLEHPSDEDYATSGYDTSTASLTNSIREYAFENGRRYHTYFGADKNPLPTDETEQDRLDVHHEVFLILLDRKLHRAPIGKSPNRILDVGTGTGIWAIDMADKYPSAEVIGVDLSPIQPGWVPPNCRFELDDAELDWTFRPDYFDFIHIRNLSQAVTKWEKVLSEAYRCTIPGGYIELAELGGVAHSDDGSMSPDNGVKVFLSLLDSGLRKMGRVASATGESLRANLEDAGFVDIDIFTCKQPLAPWAHDKKLKQVGAVALLSAPTGFHAYGMAVFTRVLGMDPEEADMVCKRATAAVMNKNNHIYTYFYVVHGQKPTEKE
ncbi:S-adenosyl-L-methionine-dependent methyltransferase [Tricharina praecox]|uniref:S-adenosyl-L-methionine-dependent methyltransferase n=1 Tax=Tricharina praecox TaxID=43433 RepID=UPI00221F010C|nr:S-adenosyl-L-methionine-dependent methyltransferase [Tricharina praecox]KAI5846699.1 S-adenosyl-L-methionine-dependent methyltransferase [Tricharina praecox]